ncbi:hypothetical protein [Streptacidiphilus anmyonensis]|uniref:hypothetical protein n=1 Tax=Streptacidiphilus anmyonensis TaxID=405782 RepID=UPI0005AAB404|nr:hypothetical protein [Streptacidiphilus anmyonensis]
MNLSHTEQHGTELECPYPAALVSPALRPIGWSPRPGGRWRLRGSAGRPADERRIRLTTQALRRRGFTLATPARPHAPCPQRPHRARPARTPVHASTPSTTND